MSDRLILALCTATKLVHTRDLFAFVPALQLNVDHCAAAYGLESPDIVVIDDELKLPPGCHQIVCVDDDTDPGTLAVHYPGPAGRVYASRASGFETGDTSVCEAIAHEALEIVPDPDCDKWVPHPNADRAAAGVQVALECCDPCQDTYMVSIGGKSWPVANFVQPAWFRLPAPIEQRNDYRGELAFPGDVGPEGYLILRAPSKTGDDYVTWFESRTGPQLSERKAASIAHPWSRTFRRGVRLAA